MKLLYTHSDRLLVTHYFYALRQAGFEVVLRNEFAGAAAGELSPFDTWLEIWLQNESTLLKARQHVKWLGEGSSGADQRCQHCGESSPPGFAVCWQCNQPLQSQPTSKGIGTDR